jgi:photosystem II stability/assembly factor-like uncharacterized protein
VTAFSALAATAGAQRVSLGWAWQNPAPLGSIARGVVRAGPYEYAIGADGTLLRSSDGGGDWTVIDTGIEEPVSRLEVIDESALVIDDAAGCATEISTDAGETFARIFNSSSSCVPVAAFSFLSPSVGFILLKDGAVERTSDGGRSFSPGAPLPGTPAANEISDEKRFAASEGRGVELHFSTAGAGLAFVTPSTGPSAAYATSDGGMSWSTIALPAKAEVEHLDFVNAETAYATGPSTLLYSSDAGATWQAVAIGPLDESPEAVFCSAANGCLATLWLTTNLIALHGAAPPSSFAAPLPLCAVSGQLPSLIVTVPESSRPENASVLSGDAGEACAPETDGAAEIDSEILGQGPGELIYAPGPHGHLALSSDEGRVWRTISAPSSARLIRAVSFASSSEGVTLGGDGVVRETVDGGTTWQTLATGTSGTPRAVTLLAPRTLLALGESGIRRSAARGPFTTVGGRAAGAAHLFRFDSAGSAVFAYGENTLFRSTDAGARWTELGLPRGGREGTLGIKDISFISPTRGWALDGWGTLFSTIDAGRHWRQVLAAGPVEALSVRFVNGKDGYLTGLAYGPNERDTDILHTSDGGATWSPEYVGPGWLDSPVVATGTAAAVLLQEPNSGVTGTMLYTTSSSGEAGAESARVAIHASRRMITARELLAHHGALSVTISGTVSTHAAGETVILGRLNLQGAFWDSRLLRTGPGGRFTMRWRIGASSAFVAQWIGGPGQTGAGSRPITITVSSR